MYSAVLSVTSLVFGILQLHAEQQNLPATIGRMSKMSGGKSSILLLICWLSEI